MTIVDLFPFGWTMLAVLAIGAAVAGFVTGLAGFGTALVALAFWLHVMDARLASPLVAFCAVASQVTSLGVIWRGMAWRRLWPMMLGGVMGLPLGVMLLDRVDTQWLKGAVGLVLVFYSLYNLLRGHVRIPHFGGRTADGIVGGFSGVLGGASGLAGVGPTLWCAMRGWSPDQQRGTYQPFTLAILALSIPGHAMNGSLDRNVLAASLVAVPISIAAGWLGVACYGRLDADQFRRIVLWLLLVSGILLLAPLLWP